jgi:hypothetical protein
MPETWPGFDGLIRTRACTRDAHSDCAHLLATGGGSLGRGEFIIT